MHYTYHMSSKDKVSKSVWGLFEFTKETVKKNLVQATNNNELKLDENSLRLLLNIVDSSISEGYNKGIDSTAKNVASLFSESDNSKKKK